MRHLLRVAIFAICLIQFNFLQGKNTENLNSYPPTAVCEGYTVVALNDQGIGKVFATSLDDGSHDGHHNYNNLWFKVIRMDDENVDAATDPYGCGSSGEQWQFACDGLNGDDNWYNTGNNSYDVYYDDFAKFCCDDVGAWDVMVIMRVFNKNPGSGPVDPDRMKPGGDLYGHFNDCMVNIEVQSNISSHCVAPPDVWLDCDTPVDIWDLSQFGTATGGYGGCGGQIEELDPIDHRECGVGHIIRRWKIWTYGSSPYICEQYIKFKNNDPFDEHDIIWPANYESNSCGAGDLDPENLPARFSPRYRSGSQNCSLIASDYRDMTFTIVPDACFKVVREWVVIDWCVYDPNGPWPDKGLWRHYQILKVADDDAPEILSPCYDRVFCDSSATGCSGYANLTIEVDDCTPEEYIVYDYFIDANNDGTYDITGSGKNASGVYPFGTHKILWRVEDKCGNESTCQYKFTVQDCKKPTPYCFSPTTVLMPSSLMIEIWANDLDAGSFDNCSQQLYYSFGPNYLQTQATTITCDDLEGAVYDSIFGYTLYLQMWVTEVFPGGRINQDFCTVPVIIQDNEQKCGVPGSMISGVVSSAMSEQTIENVEIKLMGESAELNHVMSNTSGIYSFPPVYPYDEFHVRPYKNDDPLNGVSTDDIIQIQKHLFGIEKFDSPYQYIAADVDGNQRVSANDMLLLRDLVLGVTDTLTETTSWKFFDRNQQFATMNAPWPLKEEVTFDSIHTLHTSAVFMGVKIGDVDGTAIVNSSQDTVLNPRAIDLQITETEFVSGDEINVPITLKESNDLRGAQMTIAFDANKLALQNIESSALDINRNNLGLHKVEEGIITFSWNNADGETIESLRPILDIQFKAKADGSLSETMALNSSITKAEVYVNSNDTKGINLQFVDKSGQVIVPVVASEFELFQNQPNPFKDQTSFQFSLPRALEVEARILDINGRLLKIITRDFEKGMNDIQIDSKILNGPGVYFFQLTAGKEFTANKRFVSIQ